jgi:hypothetical protein
MDCIPNTPDVPSVSTSTHSELQTDSELPESERTTNDGPNLNPNQTVTKNNVEGKVLTTNANQRSTMYENTTSMYPENIYEKDIKNRLNSN